MTAMTDEKRVSDDTSQPDMQSLDPKAEPVAWIAPHMVELLRYGRETGNAWQYLMSPVATDKFTVPLYASLPQQTAEPVAWRWRESAGDAWVVQEASTLPDGVQFQPLYTHPASPPVGGAVKVLEWRAIGDQWQADTSIGWYSIRPGDDPDFAADLFLSAAPVASYATETQAKAAAQADYEQRILAALELRASDRETVDALRKLVSAVENMRVPQNIAEAAIQVEITIGPALRNAQAAIRKLSEVSHEH